eukprot:UN10952
MVEQVLNGYNAILVVYGQTGSGKSFTMLGVGGEQEGLMPASLSLFLKGSRPTFICRRGVRV